MNSNNKSNLPKKDQLNIQHINAQSLLGNFDNLELLMKENNVDIMCVSETWLYPTLQSSFINIPEHSVYCCDGGRGGGHVSM